MAQSFFPGGDLPKNDGLAWQLYDSERKKAAKAKQCLENPNAIDFLNSINDRIADASDRVVNKAWDGIGNVLKSVWNGFRCILPLLVWWVLVSVLHFDIFIALLIACGVGPFDLIRGISKFNQPDPPSTKDKTG